MKHDELSIGRWGNNLGLRIPAALAKRLRMRAGSRVRIFASRSALLIKPQRSHLKKNSTKNISLARLVRGITPDNQPQMCADAPRGQEIW